MSLVRNFSILVLMFHHPLEPGLCQSPREREAVYLEETKYSMLSLVKKGLFSITDSSSLDMPFSFSLY
jgi:hypothetical protein